MMKLARTAAILLLCSGAAFGQADVKSKDQCRPLKSGDFIASNEYIVGSASNTMVCPRPAQVAEVRTAALSTSDATPTPVGARVGPRVNPGFAQGTVPRIQFAAGYQYDSANLSGYGVSTSRVNTNGAFMQVMGNVRPYLAVIGNVDAIYKSQVYLFTYAGGVQANPIGHRVLTPFVRGTIGAGTIHVQNYGTTTGFAWQFGGGLDYHLRREGRLGLRLLQFDYGQVRKQGVSLNSIKLGTGITF
jgi:hypothetical protein